MNVLIKHVPSASLALITWINTFVSTDIPERINLLTVFHPRILLTTLCLLTSFTFQAKQFGVFTSFLSAFYTIYSCLLLPFACSFFFNFIYFSHIALTFMSLLKKSILPNFYTHWTKKEKKIIIFACIIYHIYFFIFSSPIKKNATFFSFFSFFFPLKSTVHS